MFTLGPLMAHPQLERLETTLSTVSLSLGSIRNAFAPINALPRETLAHIFKIFASFTSTPSSFLADITPHAKENPNAWLVVTHVCQFWRETAFAFPSLWSPIDSTYPSAALAFLERSSTSPLRVYLRDTVLQSGLVPALDRTQFLQTVSQHSPRFVELHLQPQFRYGPAILRFFRYPAPQLKALTISLNIGRDEQPDLPTLFGGQTPNLEKLTLCNFSSWPGNPTLGAHLTHLCLYDQHPRGRLTMEGFIAILATCPRLEELILVEAGPRVVPTAYDSSWLDSPREHELLDLHNLRTLHLGNWTSHAVIARFLSHLILPQSTSVHIWADCLFHSTDTLTTLLPASTTHLHPLHGITVVHLLYRPTLRDSPQLLAVSDQVLVIHFYYVASTAENVLLSVFSKIDLRNIEELTIGVDCEPEMPSERWRPIFKAMPRLRKLNILRRPSGRILSALGTAPHSGDLDLVCPALSSITITDDRALSPIRLFLVAETRSRLGTPLQSLRIVTTISHLHYSSQNQKMIDEIEDLKGYIRQVQYVENDQELKLPLGWPSSAFKWVMARKKVQGSMT
ncbi:hypothetical protein PHLCEN_2v1500 [Hermanssonia centrifuga]|uniref:Uncharacterized protein n=1 Tax=Hermanssonia centrifuga TaxID=98765 RepID=A0A2R6RZW1_9APHY|nr:hypothetical protein PHLCEN_2v1500 [Hermanssonia centrifuga]